MPVVSKVTFNLFTAIKSELIFSDPLTVAIKNSLSRKTILQIKASENYQEYEALKQAMHPPNTSTMRDDIKEINRKLDILVANSKENKLL